MVNYKNVDKRKEKDDQLYIYVILTAFWVGIDKEELKK